MQSCDMLDGSHDQDNRSSRQLARLYPTHLLRGQREEVVTDRILIVLFQKINLSLYTNDILEDHGNHYLKDIHHRMSYNIIVYMYTVSVSLPVTQKDFCTQNCALNNYALFLSIVD